MRGLAAILLLAALAAPRVARAQLSPDERRVAEWVDAHAPQSLALLERVVNQNSGTMHHEGVRRAGAILAPALEEIGFTTRWVEMPEAVGRAGHLFAQREGRPGAPRVLLIGHLDTVFEPGHPFQRFTPSGARATGPGVIDMKGGDVAIVTALQALAAVGALDGLSVTVALIGDEEQAGLPVAVSRAALVEAGRVADVALGFEPGDPRTAVVARRGSSNWRVRVTGRQGHSSGVFGEALGSGAIYEVARILHRFHDEVRTSPTVTFNPGVLLGGTDVTYDEEGKRGAAAGKTNVVAQTAVAEGDLRFLTDDEKEAARARMREIAAANLPGTRAAVTFEDKYPAMPPTDGNRRLLARFSEVSRDLGMGSVTAFDPGSRGAADISFVAPYVDGIDGLGPWGGGSHSPNEWMEVSSLAAATKRAAVLLHRLAAPPAAAAAAAPVAADTVALTVAPPDTLVPDLVSQILHHAVAGNPTCPGESGRVAPGDRTCFMLLYGWRGTEPAPNVRLSVGAGEGVSIVGASRPPSAMTPTGVRWDLGTLAPGTYGDIIVQVEIARDASGTVRLDSYVAADVSEDAANNGSWAVVQVGG